MRTTTRLLAIVGTSAAIAAAGALPAFADGTTAQFDKAIRTANGAGVHVTVSVTCDPYTDWGGNYMTSTPVDVTLTQAVRRGNMTSGTAEGTATCDSTAHEVTVLVVPAPYAFNRGSALVWVTPTFDTAISPPVVAGATIRIR
jgi:hypothetical protein